MSIQFKILEKTHIYDAVPLVYKLNDLKVTEACLKQRFSEMIHQNYECAGIFDDDKLIGVCGLWYCTRHYSGKSAEADHVYIDDGYRGQGLGKKFFDWIYKYLIDKGIETIELNTYVSNNPSHKFYYNEGFNILGYHFLKKL